MRLVFPTPFAPSTVANFGGFRSRFMSFASSVPFQLATSRPFRLLEVQLSGTDCHETPTHYRYYPLDQCNWSTYPFNPSANTGGFSRIYHDLPVMTSSLEVHA